MGRGCRGEGKDKPSKLAEPDIVTHDVASARLAKALLLNSRSSSAGIIGNDTYWCQLDSFGSLPNGHITMSPTVPPLLLLLLFSPGHGQYVGTPDSCNLDVNSSAASGSCEVRIDGVPIVSAGTQLFPLQTQLCLERRQLQLLERRLERAVGSAASGLIRDRALA